MLINILLIKQDNMVWTKLVRHLSVFSMNNLNSVQVWDSKKENVGTKTSFLMTVLCVCSVVSDFFVTPWTVACQAPLSMRFPREKYCSELSLPAPGGSSQPGDQTQVSCISSIGRLILCHCATWEVTSWRHCGDSRLLSSSPDSRIFEGMWYLHQ